MFSTCPLISKSSDSFINPLGIVPSAPVIIGITVTSMFHSYFISLARFKYLPFFSHSLNFTLWSAGTAKSTIRQVLFFFLTITRSGHLAEIRWFIFILKSQRNLCVSFFWTDSGLCGYNLFIRSNLNFLHNSQWITLYYLTHLRVLHICVSWWFSTEVWGTASLKSRGFFLVFWPNSTTLLFGWSSFVLLFPSPPVPAPILWWLYPAPNYIWYHRHFHVPYFFLFSWTVYIFISLFAFLQFYPVVCPNVVFRFS